jgi:putative endonuclease
LRDTRLPAHSIAAMHFVYILKCADQTLYVGYTKDLKRRVHQHNHAKQGARYTKTRRPVVLLYFERFRIRRKALQREYEIKTWPRAKKLALIAAKKKPPASTAASH